MADVPIENAQQVTVEALSPGSMTSFHPALLWIMSGFTILVLAGFALITYWVLFGDVGEGVDAATKGSLIQTWNNLAVAATAVFTGTKLLDVMARKTTPSNTNTPTDSRP